MVISHITKQKWGFIFINLLLNAGLITLYTIYQDYWYIFLGILIIQSFINSVSVLLLMFKKIFCKNIISLYSRVLNQRYVYLVPVYNESEEELKNNFSALSAQSVKEFDERYLIIVCDGTAKGPNSEKTTKDILVEDVLGDDISECIHIPNAYQMADDQSQSLELYFGHYEKIKYMLLIKEKNAGKRDSLTIIRRLLLLNNNNKKTHPKISEDFIDTFSGVLNDHFTDSITYVIGIDGDTIFEENCTNELLKSIDDDPNIFGVVGFVEPLLKSNSLNPFYMFQYAEYIYAQCLRRQFQSEITQRVNCLSGCVQILRVEEETCGDFLLDKFNYKPVENENIMKHILSYASEDRNHICLAFSIYPYMKTIQTLKAKAYTDVPSTFSVFFSQRRRWSLGANFNDFLLVISRNIKLVDKLVALSNILIWGFMPYILYAGAIFIKTIILRPSMLMLFLSIVILIPMAYALFIPFILGLTFKQTLYFYLSFAFYLMIGPIIHFIIFFNSIINMDQIKWGKTRKAVLLN